MTDEQQIIIDVDGTPVRAVVTRPEDAAATIVVAHGAGAGMEHPFVSGFTRAMDPLGFATLRFNFPFREAGRRFPDRPAVAIATWRAAMAGAAARAADAGSADEPIWASGKSFGGRMASMAVAEGMPAAGLVFLGYPLHPPGRPEKAHDEHLTRITVPMLFLQGRNDPFAIPNEQLDDVVELHRARRHAALDREREPLVRGEGREASGRGGGGRARGAGGGVPDRPHASEVRSVAADSAARVAEHA